MTHLEKQERRKVIAECIRSGEAPAAAARRFQVSLGMVCGACQEFGVSRHAAKMAARLALVADGVANGTTAKMIAAQSGIGYESVLDYCRKMGIKPVRPSRRGVGAIVATEAWDNVDWRKRDTDIAQELGISRERVRQVRKILGKPSSRVHGQSKAFAAALAWVKSNEDRISGLTISEVATLCPLDGIGRNIIHRAMLHVGLKPAVHKSGWGITKDNLKSFCTESTTGCWEWDFTTLPNGYSRVGGKYGHRLSYELNFGPIPFGKWVLHRCDNPKCVNPAHLYPGGALENARDRKERGRNGKPMSPEEITEIRRLYAMGAASLPQLAEQFNRSYTTIYKAVKGKTWSRIVSPVQAVA